MIRYIKKMCYIYTYTYGLASLSAMRLKFSAPPNVFIFTTGIKLYSLLILIILISFQTEYLRSWQRLSTNRSERITHTTKKPHTSSTQKRLKKSLLTWELSLYFHTLFTHLVSQRARKFLLLYTIWILGAKLLLFTFVSHRARN